LVSFDISNEGVFINQLPNYIYKTDLKFKHIETLVKDNKLPIAQTLLTKNTVTIKDEKLSRT
jgi:hypothetical protein